MKLYIRALYWLLIVISVPFLAIKSGVPYTKSNPFPATLLSGNIRLGSSDVSCPMPFTDVPGSSKEKLYAKLRFEEENESLSLLHHSRETFPWSSFDWKAYLFYYPELGNLTEAAAKQHFSNLGFHEGRIYRRVPMTIRYHAMAGGLCNQLYSYLHAFTVAEIIGANNVILPPLIHRTTFEIVNNSMWSTAAPDTVFNVSQMARYWAQRNISVKQGPHYGRGQRIMLKTNCVVIMVGTEDIYLESPISITSVINKKIVNTLTPMILGNPENLEHVCIHIQLGRSFRALHGARSLPYITLGAKGLVFSDELTQAAERVINSMPAKSFLGVHLRIEGDFVQAFGQTPLEAYIRKMKEGGFTPQSLVYAASGIFSYANTTGVSSLLRELREASVTGKLVYRESLTTKDSMSGFNSEQLAMIDMLVLLKADRVVGHCKSTFSFFLLELRALHGHSKDTFFMVPHKDCERQYELHHGGLAFTPGNVSY